MGSAATYPTSVWDGDSRSRDSDNGPRRAPDYHDWSRLIAELAAVQKQLGVGSDADAVAAVGTVGTGVTEVSERTSVQRTVLNITDLAITITDDTTKEWGGALIHTFPAGAIKVLGVTLDLTLISAADFAGTGAGELALGSAIASDQALAGTQLTWTTDAAALTGITSVVSNHHDQGETVALYDGTSTPAPVYLNIAMTNAEGAGVVTVNGTITITWVNCGDY